MEGVIHLYNVDPPLNLFEYTPRPSNSSVSLTTPPNIILFVGGLYDNFQSPGYLKDLAELFPRFESQKWALIHIQLSSAIVGFGTSDIDHDIEEMSLAITYIRSVIRQGQPTSIVLMGHSTGCQDVLHYLSATIQDIYPRPQVQGAIFQAPVSDREAVHWKITVVPQGKELLDQCLTLIETITPDRHKSYMLPLDWTRLLFGRAPLCISRFLDLVSPTSPSNPRKEDMFSTDLPPFRHANTWGQIGPKQLLSHNQVTDPRSPAAILILFSELDTKIFPPGVDCDSLLKVWNQALLEGSQDKITTTDYGKMVANATHDFSGDALPQQRARLVQLRESVIAYLDRNVAPVDKSAFDIVDEANKRLEKLEKETGHN